MAVSRLVYASRATGSMDTDTIETILRNARRANEKDGISGLLVASDDQFLQILEGPKAAVDATFARIRRDSRHQDVEVVHTHENGERQFPDWVMGFISRDRAPAEHVMHWYWANDDNIHALLPEDVDPDIRDLFANFCTSGRRALLKTG